MSTNQSPLTPAQQGYVPTDEWPDVTTMVDGFGEPSLAGTAALEGEPLVIRYEGESRVEYHFDAGEVTWSIRDGEGLGASGQHPYRAVEVRPGLFYVDFIRGDSVRARDISLVIDVKDGRVTEASSSFVDRDGAIRMSTEIRSGHIEGTGEIEPLERTSELVGKRIYYRYSPTEHYEHVYLNAGTFVWHCVRGGEVGLADVDPIQVWSVADGIVLLHWSETVMPVESIVLIDLKQKRSVGRMFCWDGPTLDTVHIPFDSEFTVLSDVPYPAE